MGLRMRNRLPVVAVLMVLGILIVGHLWSVPVSSKYREVCRVCRAERNAYSSFGSKKYQEQDNEFASWHRSTFQPHEHDWRQSGCGREFNFLGQGCGVFCAIIDPFAELSSEEERQFLASATLEEWKEFFRLLQSKDPVEARSAASLVKASIRSRR